MELENFKIVEAQQAFQGLINLEFPGATSLVIAKVYLELTRLAEPILLALPKVNPENMTEEQKAKYEEILYAKTDIGTPPQLSYHIFDNVQVTPATLMAIQDFINLED